MIKKVYLLWHTYVTNELLTVASLTKKEKNYAFKYETDAIKALEYGCMLPFNYTKEEILFTSLPHFFAQRMLNSEIINRLGIKVNLNDEFEILTINSGRRNNDNFYIVKENIYEKLKESMDSKVIK